MKGGPFVKTAKVLGIVVSGLLALVLLTVGFLLTPWGNEIARKAVMPKVNEILAGDVRVGGFRFTGRRVILNDLELRDPTGQVVAAVNRIELRLSPLALISGRLDLSAVHIFGPKLFLIVDERGSNFARALASDKPARQEEAAGKPVLVVVRKLELRDGLIDIRLQTGARPAHQRIQGVNAVGEGRWDGGDESFTAKLGLDGAVRAPVIAPLRIDFEGQGRKQQLSASLRATLDRTAIDASVKGQSAERMIVTLRRLLLTPKIARALSPGYPITTDVVASGTVDKKATQITSDLKFDAGGATITVRGSMDTDRLVTSGLTVKGERIDLSRLIDGGPRSALSFTFDARGGGRSLGNLQGEARLSLPRGQMESRSLGPIALHARAQDGRYDLVSLDARLPGVTVEGDATLRGQRLSGNAKVKAQDLGALVRALDGPGGGTLPAVTGQGALTVKLGGTLAHPGIEVQGRFSRLSAEGNTFAGLTFNAALPDVKQPTAARALVQVARAKLGGRAFAGLRADLVSAPGGELRLDATLADPKLELRTRGRWQGQLLTLRTLELAYPEAQWMLKRPAMFVFGDELQVKGLVLQAGGQRVVVDLARSDRRLDAHLALQAIDLGRLPKAFVAPELRLGGRLTADVRAKGRPSSPSLAAKVTLADGRFQQFEDVGLELDGDYGRGRVSGTTSLSALGAKVNARFDLPAVWPRAPGAPLSLALSVDGVDLARLRRALAPRAEASVGPEKSGPVEGQGQLALSVTGTAGAPRIVLEGNLSTLRVRAQPVGDVSIAATVSPGEPLEAKVGFDTLGSKGEIRVSMKLPTSLLDPPTQAQLMTAPLQVQAQIDKLPLAPLALLAGRPAPVQGTATLAIAIDGTAMAPRGKMDLSIAGAATTGLPPTDAVLKVTADDDSRGLEIALSVNRRQKVLAFVKGTLGVPSRHLGDLAVVAAAPLQLDAQFGPFELQRLGLPSRTEREPAHSLRGRAEGKLRFGGSLAAPQLQLEASVSNLRFEPALMTSGGRATALGEMSVKVAYKDALAKVDVDMLSEGGGRLTLDVEAAADLGYRALAHGLEFRRVPVKASLQAKGFDLAGLSGLVDSVPVVAGQLSGESRFDGPLGTPRMQGRVELTKGRLIVRGKGEYKDIHLLVHGDQQRMVLEKLSVRSGAGTVKVRAEATRKGDSGIALSMNARASKFPFYSDGQELATVSVNTNVKGTASADQIALETSIEEAQVELSDKARRDVQEFKRPEDVVLFRRGQPANKAEKRRHERLLASWKEKPPEDAAGDKGNHRKQGGGGEREVRITIQAPRNLWVRGKDMLMEVGLGPDFVVSITDEPRVFGVVLIRRGQVEVLGRRFRVSDESEVRFLGRPEAPVLDVRAVHESRKANMNVVVIISGPVDALSFALSSPEHPEYTRSELLMVLMTGRAPDQAGGPAPTPVDRATSLFGSLIANRLQKSLLKRLPVDVLNLDTVEGTEGLRVETGKYIGEDLYMAYVGKLGAATDPFRRKNRNEVHLEYQLTRRWSLEGIYGDARQGSADLVWTKRY